MNSAFTQNNSNILVQIDKWPSQFNSLLNIQYLKIWQL